MVKFKLKYMYFYDKIKLNQILLALKADRLTYNSDCTFTNQCLTSLGLSCNSSTNTCQCSGGQWYIIAVEALYFLFHKLINI